MSDYMMNNYLRGAIVALSMAVICAPICIGLSSSTARASEPVSGSAMAMVAPAANQIDAFGYAASPSASLSDTGSLIALSPAMPPHLVLASAGATSALVADTTTSEPPAPASATTPLASLDFLNPNAPENKSIKALYDLNRITTLAQPHLDVTFFGGGLASEDYYLTDEGIQLEQSITEGLGIVGRATGYQLWIEKNATSPLAPSNKVANRLNFGRFEAGFDLSPMTGFNFVLLGGHDVGDSDAWIIESDISMWFFLADPHPLNIYIAPVHDFQNDVTSSEIDFRVVAAQTPDWVLLLGVGGQVFGGGFVDGLEGEGGPIVGIYNRLYQLGADLQFGYGSPGFYGELNLYKTLSLPGL
jgi:hypothetical protein